MQLKNDLYISGGIRPFKHRVIAAALYTSIIALLVLAFERMDFSFNYKTGKGIASILELSILLLLLALRYSLVIDLYFDLDRNRYMVKLRVGPIGFGKWITLPKLDYISVFYSENKSLYDVNAWYGKNKHVTLFRTGDEQSALKGGCAIALKYEIELIDSTDPHNKRWLTDTEMHQVIKTV